MWTGNEDGLVSALLWERGQRAVPWGLAYAVASGVFSAREKAGWCPGLGLQAWEASGTLGPVSAGDCLAAHDAEDSSSQRRTLSSAVCSAAADMLTSRGTEGSFSLLLVSSGLWRCRLRSYLRIPHSVTA